MTEDILFKNLISFWECGLYIPKSSYLVYFDEVRTTSIQDQKTQHGRSVDGLRLNGKFSLKHNIKPPPKRL